MPDPGSFLTAKVVSGLGGLLGGLTMMTYIKPRNLLDASIRGGISTGSGIIFAAPILEALEVSTKWEMQLMAGFIIGFLSWGIFSLIARIFINAEKNKEDLIDVVNRGRSGKPTNE